MGLTNQQTNPHGEGACGLHFLQLVRKPTSLFQTYEPINLTDTAVMLRGLN